jgi:hypothetical protein
VSRTKRRVVWVAGVVAIVLLLTLTPPLMNVNRLRRRIAASMSASLGRPVHLDKVTIHLLPVPGFTLENLVVSEDPAFGYEPTIRANVVEATLRPSSLWRRQVEFSTIRFIEPSLNLVRNAQGKWNLQSLLVHAAKVDTAPTEQSKAGPEPRFPYIEATGARVNLKLGDEKKPFSLTDADFALWLPTPAEWRMRLEAKPARTDTNISDPGTVRMEGSLRRAASMAAVPVDLRASWEGAPLGEASKLLRGEDADWRGNLTVEATLQGELGAAKLATKVHFEDLRRADFVPTKSLDVAVECTGVLEMMTAVVHTPACSVPAEKVTAVAESVDLTVLRAKGLTIGTPETEEGWLLDWARLFSQRLPGRDGPAGMLKGSVAQGEDGAWSGGFEGDVDSLLPTEKRRMVPVTFNVSAANGVWTLRPVDLLMMPPGAGGLMLSGSATAGDGVTLRLEGTATSKQMLALREAWPQLADGMPEVVPGIFDAGTEVPVKVGVTCSRPWHAGQVCAVVGVEPVKRLGRRR